MTMNKIKVHEPKSSIRLASLKVGTYFRWSTNDKDVTEAIYLFLGPNRLTPNYLCVNIESGAFDSYFGCALCVPLPLGSQITIMV